MRRRWTPHGHVSTSHHLPQPLSFSWQVVEQRPNKKKREMAYEDHSRYGVVSDDDVSCETKEKKRLTVPPHRRPLAAKKTI